MEVIAIGISIVTFLALLLAITIIVFLYFQIRKLQASKGDIIPVLQAMTQTIQQEQTQIAILGEKLSHIEPITQTTSELVVDIRGLGERVAKIESNQTMVYQGVGYLANNASSSFSELKTLTSHLTETTTAMREELTRAKNDLTELHTHAKTGQETERQIAESIRRLETVIAGTQSKGSAGENILEVVFAKLPIEWQVRDFKIGGKAVEFGLRLPNNLIMPIDSKWTSTHLLEQFKLLTIWTNNND